MLVHEIAAGEEADHVADIGKHMVSRKTTISPLWTTRSYRTLSWLMKKKIMSPALRNTPGQYTGITNHNEQQWQFNGIKEISKKYPRIELQSTSNEQRKSRRLDVWYVRKHEHEVCFCLAMSDNQYKIHLKNRPHTTAHSYVYTHFKFSDKTEKLQGPRRGRGW